MDKKNLKLITALRQELHAHPELSGQEHWTRRRLMTFLREHTALRVIDRGNWFYAVCKSSSGEKKPVAFRADFDAVPVEDQSGKPYASKNPGVGHMCGHDGHSAALAGLALELDQTGPRRDVYLIFQHAEETGRGALECASLFDEIDIAEIFAFHTAPHIPQGFVMARDGSGNCASKGMILRFEGAASHASRPEDGRNPAPAIAAVITALPALSAGFRGIVMSTVIHVRIGSPAFGTSPGEGALMLTIRGEYEAEMGGLQAGIEALAQDEARRHGLKCAFEYCDVFPEIVNHPASAQKVREAAVKQGLQIYEQDGPTRWSEDFGHYLKRARGAFFKIGAGPDCAPLHSTKYDFPDGVLETAVELFKLLI